MTLTDVLAPLNVDKFLHEYVGKRFVVLKGRPERFHGLVPWDDLNSTLSRLRVTDRRVSLVKNAKAINTDSYVVTSKRGGAQYIRGPTLMKQLSDGATLVVNQVDELFPRLRQLAESCENLLRIYVSANMYVAWRTDNGFDVHWDTHDTLILQIRGRKTWKVWAPTREHPLSDEIDDPKLTPSPPTSPVWEGVLEDGDLLYMPRGWWHVASPRDELSQHVTVGFTHPTGMDFLAWVMDSARDCVEARMDVPHWEESDALVRWTRLLLDRLTATMSDGGVVEKYMRHLDSQAHTRPIVTLPQTMRRAALLDDSSRLRLSQGRAIHIDVNGEGAASFTLNGRQWSCDARLVPALRMLRPNTPHTLPEMRMSVEPAARPLLFQFLTALVMVDAIWVEPTVDTATVVADAISTLD